VGQPDRSMSVPRAQNAGHSHAQPASAGRASNVPYWNEYLPLVLILAEV
jgi:hypothetical protein